MQRNRGWLLLVISSMVLAACAPLRPGIESLTVADEEFNLPPASENTAVLALLDQARTESAGERAAGAAATIERALRIEPRNPRLWLELARHHLAQGDTQQAEQLAQRANAFAGSDRLVRAAGWKVIASARRQRGDEAGAEAAEARVREFRR
jgi:predicted Zn-dependent protease